MDGRDLMGGGFAEPWIGSKVSLTHASEWHKRFPRWAWTPGQPECEGYRKWSAWLLPCLNALLEITVKASYCHFTHGSGECVSLGLASAFF